MPKKEAGGIPRVVHASSAHRVSDVRIHLREAATVAAAGFDVHLIANAHDVELPLTGVKIHPRRPRARWARVTVSSVAVVIRALRLRPAIVHLHDPELVWAIFPLRALGIKVVYDAHEDLPVQVLSKHYLGSLARPAALLARLVVRHAGKADGVVAATETIARTFPEGRVTLVRNYPTVRGSVQLTPINDRPLAVAYLGVMGAERGTEQMIESFGCPDFPEDWKVILAGPLPADYMATLTKIPGWERVDYRGFVSTDEARDLLDQARVGIVTLKRTPAYLDSLPTKMFEYFAAGIPAIASDFPLWRKIIETHDCGLLVDEQNPSSIAEAVAKYAHDPQLLARHSENALRASKQELNWTAEGERLLAMYENLLERSRE